MTSKQNPSKKQWTRSMRKPVVVLFGTMGQLGHELSKLLPYFCDVFGPTKQEVDVTKADQLANFVADYNPDLVVNCAAYNDVDGAETSTGRETAARVNYNFPSLLGQMSKVNKFGIVHFSSDYVFSDEDLQSVNGGQIRPDTEPHPSNLYGLTKLQGENVLLDNPDAPTVVIRTSCLYSSRRINLVKSVCGKIRREQPLVGVTDQFGSPTWARDLAYAVSFIISGHVSCYESAKEYQGVYHLTNSGVENRFNWINRILELTSGSSALTPRETTLDEYYKQHAHAAQRPKNIILDTSKTLNTFGVSMRHWSKALEECLHEFK